MMRLMIACLLLSVSLASAQSLGNRIESLVAGYLEKNKAVGVSVAVAKGNKILFAGGFGLADRDGKVAAGKETVYRIGSVTKQFTAAL